MNNHLLPYPYNQSGKQPRFLAPCQSIAKVLSGLTKRTRLPSTECNISKHAIRIVCVSDTHNATPDIPEGDLFIHAGDLTQRGTFDEVQAQLNWIQKLPHTFKVVIAGNHDLLLDREFVKKFPHRAPLEPGCLFDDLSWSDIHYLHDDTVTLNFEKQGARQVKVFGSPNTPEFGTWAFQYPPIRDIWTNRIPDDIDVVVAHGPPVLHLDVDRKGDGYFLTELRRVKPKLVVFGHIHDGYGQADLLHDDVESSTEQILMGWRGIGALMSMTLALMICILRTWVRQQPAKRTHLVNAAVAAGEKTHAKKSAISISI